MLIALAFELGEWELFCGELDDEDDDDDDMGTGIESDTLLFVIFVSIPLDDDDDDVLLRELGDIEPIVVA